MKALIYALVFVFSTTVIQAGWIQVNGSEVSDYQLILKISEIDAPLLGIEDPLTLKYFSGLSNALDSSSTVELEPLFHNYQTFNNRQRANNLHRYYLLSIDQQLDFEWVITILKGYPEIESVFYDGKMEVGYDPDDPEYSNQWAHSNTGQVNPDGGGAPVGTQGCDGDTDLAWDLTTGDPDVIIAILDTGIDMDHPEFQGKIVSPYDFVNNDTSPDDYASPKKYHGTACSGIAAAIGNNYASVAGVAWNCKVMPVKVMNDSGSGTYSRIANGVEWAVDHGADIINMSIMGGADGDDLEILEAAINDAFDADILCIGITGNDDDNTILYPGNFANCLAVGALSPCNTRKSAYSCDGESGWGSNYGPNIDFLAPGTRIYTTTNGGGFQDEFNGTSAAAPYVAGVAALMLSVNPALTPTELKTILGETCVDIAPQDFDNGSGWGRVNAYQAVLRSLPPQSIIFKNRSFSDPNGNFTNSTLSIFDLEDPTNDYENIPSGESRSVRMGIRHTVQTNGYEYDNNNSMERHWAWAQGAGREYKLKIEDFQSVPTPEMTAQYKARTQLTFEGIGSTMLEFRDPWAIENPNDQGGWIQNDEFKTLSDHFDDDGSFFVFLQQNQTLDPDLPIYQIKAPNLVCEGDQILQFSSWDISNSANVNFYADMNHPFDDRYKSVVFTGQNPSIKVNYTAVNNLAGVYTVLPDDKLIIPSGTSLLFKSSLTSNPGEQFSLQVEGELSILPGAVLGADIEGGFWGGIELLLGGKIGVEGAHLKNAQTAISIEQINGVTQQTEIKHSLFTNNYNALIVLGNNEPVLSGQYVEVSNCTFVNNTLLVLDDAPGGTGYIPLPIIFKNNIAQNIQYFSASVATVGYNWYHNCDDETENGDPLFIDPTNGDFRLQGNSPCIDAGDPNSPNDPDDGMYADIGAFHCPQIVIEDEIDIQSTTEWYGIFTIENDITLADEVSLKIVPGSILKFKELESGYSELLIYGELDAKGTADAPILFTSCETSKESKDWGGIKIFDTSNDAITAIDYCIIEYGYFGVYLNGTSPDISNNVFQYNDFGLYTYSNSPAISSNKMLNNRYGLYSYIASPVLYNNYISDNSYRGVYFSGSSTPEMYSNTVEETSGIGVYMYNHADVQFGKINTNDYGYNEIMNNQVYGIYAYYYSDPFLGTTDPYNCQVAGSNSIYSNNHTHLGVSNHSTAEAQFNHWGTSDASDFYIGSYSTLNRSNALANPPDGSVLGSSLAKSAEYSGYADCPGYDFFNPDTNSECALWYWAHDLRITDQLPVALWAWKLFVAKFPNNELAPKALVKISNFTCNDESEVLIGYLNNVLENSTYSDELRVKALELLVGTYMKNGEYSDAYECAQELLEQSLCDDQEKIALFTLIDLSQEPILGKASATISYLRTMQDRFPNDELTLIAAELMGEEVDWSMVQFEGESKEESQPLLPEEYALYHAYPNPFNPTTTIRYDLPKESQVQLNVYDITGRLVKTRVSRVQLGGSYEVLWRGMDTNGNALPSGLYLYRLQAGSYVANQKMLLLK